MLPTFRKFRRHVGGPGYLDILDALGFSLYGYIQVLLNDAVYKVVIVVFIVNTVRCNNKIKLFIFIKF